MEEIPIRTWNTLTRNDNIRIPWKIDRIGGLER